VRPYGSLWEAYTSRQGKQLNLGNRYLTADDAARARDFALLSLKGLATNQKLNFDKEAYLGANGLLPLADVLPGEEHEVNRGKIVAALL
jgi:hypothetical protein